MDAFALVLEAAPEQNPVQYITVDVGLLDEPLKGG
jgi:hypothetical protein